MDYDILINKLKLYEEENIKLKKQLEKYTHSQKEYYEKNKEVVMQKASENKKKLKETNPEKIKEYAKRAYLKRKEKLQKLKELTLENETI
jgi:predicted metal-binding transcription factor (methanogenesis marker protein 9)